VLNFDRFYLGGVLEPHAIDGLFENPLRFVASALPPEVESESVHVFKGEEPARADREQRSRIPLCPNKPVVVCG